MLALDPTITTTDPEDLVKRIGLRDKSAEQALVKQYWRGLLFILQQQTQDAHLAADLAQDAFIIVIDKARKGEIHSPAQLPAFIRQVGLNLVIANYRKEQRRNTHADDETLSYIADEKNDVLAAVTSARLADIVAQVIAELPTERDRKILHHYFIADKEKSAICQQLQLDAAHFDRVLFRARARLKQLLAAKLKIDTASVSLAHLLSLGMFLISCTDMAGADHRQHVQKIAVREKADTHHLTDNMLPRRRSVSASPSSTATTPTAGC